jgi:hypothetical protein
MRGQLRAERLLVVELRRQVDIARDGRGGERFDLGALGVREGVGEIQKDHD